MSEFNVSTRYARALISLAEDNKVIENVTNDFSLIFNTLTASRELRNILQSPVIDEQKKSDILMEIFKDKCSDTTSLFLRFVVQKNRENILLDISRRFLDIMNEKLGKIELDIISAIELSDQQKTKIVNTLESSTNKTVVPNYSLDEKLIGGFKVKIKDTVFDASVEQQLNTLKEKLLQETV